MLPDGELEQFHWGFQEKDSVTADSFKTQRLVSSLRGIIILRRKQYCRGSAFFSCIQERVCDNRTRIAAIPPFRQCPDTAYLHGFLDDGVEGRARDRQPVVFKDPRSFFPYRAFHVFTALYSQSGTVFFAQCFQSVADLPFGY